MHYSEATGPCKGRRLAQALWAGEGFFLQLDSHMRFAPGWDASLRDWLQQAEAASCHGRAVLSTYPPPFEVGLLSLCRQADYQIHGVCAMATNPEQAEF